MDKTTKVSKDAKKALMGKRLVDVGLKHGVFVIVFNGPEEMNEALDSMKLGAEIKAAIEAERAEFSALKVAGATRH